MRGPSVPAPAIAPAVVLALVLALAIGATGVVGASGSPDFEAYAPDNGVEPGEETDLEIELRNGASPEDDDSGAGETPTTEARDVVVTLEAGDAPISVKTGPSPQGTMSSQTLVSEEFTIAVDEDADPGVYEADVVVDYGYSSSSGNDRTGTDRETVEIVIEERAQFEIDGVDGDLVVGDSGTVDVEMTNAGVENASDAVVRFDSPDGDVDLVQPTEDGSEASAQAGEAYVGDWATNETETIPVRMDLADDAVARTYPITAVVDFRDGDGVDRTSRETRAGVPTRDAQAFDLENVSSDLHVGEDGTVRGELVNDGPRTVRNAVLLIDDGEDSGIVLDAEEGLDGGSNVYPRESQYAVGDLEPGESRPVEFRLGIGSEAEPGPRMLELDVRYRNAENDVRVTTDPVDARIDVEPQRDEFAVEPAGDVDATWEVGEEGRVTLEVTNVGDETLTDVEAKVFTNDPLDSADDEAFVPSLEPGESTTVAFDLSVEGGATPQTYPLRLDFRYDDERGNAVLSDTYRVPVEVVEPDDDGPSLGTIVAVGGVGGGLVVAAWYFRESLPIPARLASLPNPLARLRDRGGHERSAEHRYNEAEVGDGRTADPLGDRADRPDADDRTARAGVGSDDGRN